MPGPRIVVIGCGFFGRYHRHAWRELGVEIAGIYDVDPARARGRAAAFAIPCGAAGVIDCSYAAAVAEELFPQALVHIECERGSISVEPHFRVTTVAAGRVVHEDAAPPVRGWSEPPGAVVQDSVVALQRHWLERRAAGLSAETRAEDNLVTLALVEAAYAAAASGASVIPDLA